MIRKILGFGFVILGVIGGIFNGFFSDLFCVTCFEAEKLVLFFIFLFVEIVFIVSGASLILLDKKDIKE